MQIVNRKSKIVNGEWLPDMDLNHDKQIQSLLCYRYTIGQTSAPKLGHLRQESSRVFKLQTSNSKLQRSFKLQAPERATESFLKFGARSFFEVCPSSAVFSTVLSASPSSTRPCECSSYPDLLRRTGSLKFGVLSN